MKNDLNPDEREAFESVEAFLKNQTVFIGPDPDIMRDHGLAPRTPREHALLARDWERDRVGLMRDRLISNCNETWQVMSAIASSPGAKWGDSITGIWTASGDLAVVSTGGVLGFASITHYALRHIMKYWRGEPSIGVNDGDAFMHNDARWGSIHPADFATFMPVFAGGELACWVGCSAHLGENGAIEPAGLSPLAETVYTAGLTQNRGPGGGGPGCRVPAPSVRGGCSGWGWRTCRPRCAGASPRCPTARRAPSPLPTARCASRPTSSATSNCARAASAWWSMCAAARRSLPTAPSTRCWAPRRPSSATCCAASSGPTCRATRRCWRRWSSRSIRALA